VLCRWESRGGDGGELGGRSVSKKIRSKGRLKQPGFAKGLVKGGKCKKNADVPAGSDLKERGGKEKTGSSGGKDPCKNGFMWLRTGDERKKRSDRHRGGWEVKK